VSDCGFGRSAHNAPMSPRHLPNRRLVLISAAAAMVPVGVLAKPARLAARPEPLFLEPRETAVLVVDMQNDFGARGGMFDAAGIDISSIQRAVAPTSRVIAQARRLSMPVIYLKMGFKPDLSDAGGPSAPNWIKHQPLKLGQPSIAPDGRPSRVLIRDTWNTEILAPLAAQPGDTVLWKHRFSGFFETELEAVLKRLGARSLVVTGCTTSVCVEATIRDAAYRDYRCVLLEDCAAEPLGSDAGRSNHHASLLTIEALLGWISTSEAFLTAFPT
jgi:ureidoacrylate peracid hydrolase